MAYERHPESGLRSDRRCSYSICHLGACSSYCSAFAEVSTFPGESPIRNGAACIVHRPHSWRWSTVFAQYDTRESCRTVSPQPPNLCTTPSGLLCIHCGDATYVWILVHDSLMVCYPPACPSTYFRREI